MAIKLRHTFYAYNQGNEVKHVTGMTIVNSLSEAESKARTFLKSYYPDSEDLNIILNKQFLTIGGWVVAGFSNTNPSQAFLLIINKLP